MNKLSVADKLLTIANKTPFIYEKLSTKKTVVGSVVTVGDVSPIEHDLNIKLASNTISDFSGVIVRRYGKNWFDASKQLLKLPSYISIVMGEIIISKVRNKVAYESVAVGLLPNTTYTISACVEGEFTGRIYSFYGSSIYSSSVVNNKIFVTFNTDANGKITNGGGDKSRFYIAQNQGTSLDLNLISDTLKIYNIQLELSSNPTEYEPYKQLQTANADIDGNIEGLTSLSPNMTLVSDNSVSIECTYRSSDNPTANEKFIALQSAFFNLKKLLQKN